MNPKLEAQLKAIMLENSTWRKLLDLARKNSGACPIPHIHPGVHLMPSEVSFLKEGKEGFTAIESYQFDALLTCEDPDLEFEALLRRVVRQARTWWKAYKKL